MVDDGVGGRGPMAEYGTKNCRKNQWLETTWDTYCPQSHAGRSATLPELSCFEIN